MLIKVIHANINRQTNGCLPHLSKQFSMTTQKVAWAINGHKELSLILPDYQSPPYTSSWRLADISVYKETLLLLSKEEGNANTIHYTSCAFPFEWKSFIVSLESGLEISKLDAAPDGNVYLVFNNGQLAKIKVPENETEMVQYELVANISEVRQVSAAANGWVWVVIFDSSKGSIVKWMDPKDGQWNEIPELIHAMYVTGDNKGNAYVVTSDHQLTIINKKGKKDPITFEAGAREISVGSDGRLWVQSMEPSTMGGSFAYWSDDSGKSWNKVEGSGVSYLDAGQITSDIF